MTERSNQPLQANRVEFRVPEVDFTFSYDRGQDVLRVVIPPVGRVCIEYGILRPGETFRQELISLQDTQYEKPSPFVSNLVDRSLRHNAQYTYSLQRPDTYLEVSILNDASFVLFIVRTHDGISWQEIAADNTRRHIDSYKIEP